VKSQEEMMRAVQAAAMALDQGNLASAKEQAEAVLAVAPGEPNSSQILALALMREGNAQAALSHLRNAAKGAPNHPPVLNILGVALGLVGDRAGARKQFKNVKRLDPGFLDARFNLAQLELDDTRFGKAKAEFDAILAAQPMNADALAGKAKSLLLMQDLAGAASEAEQALIFDAGNGAALLTLAEARLRQGAFEDAREVALRTVRSPSASPAMRAHALGFAADADDRLGNYNEAFANYAEANRITLAASPGLAQEPPNAFHPKTVRRLIDFANKDGGETPMPTDERLPVFLIGFPRSGTTLLEQVLISHPSIESFGEQPALSNACEGLVLDSDGIGKLARLNADEAKQFRKRYWEEVAKHGALPEGATYLDKMPANMALLPAIAKVFPGAKVLIAIRDPRDAVLSSFQQRFEMNQAMAQMLSLESAAEYYDLLMSLTRSSGAAFDIPTHEVRYEQLVSDLEAEVRSVLSFIGVEWDAQLMDYRDDMKARTVKTPSVAQVTEPVYTRALNKWQNYASHMMPVHQILAPWVKHWGYSD